MADSVSLTGTQRQGQASLKNEVAGTIMFARAQNSDGGSMANESKRETGASLMFIGLAVWVADLLVLFFLPAGIKIGHKATFVSIILVLAVVGLILGIAGYSKRGRLSEE